MEIMIYTGERWITLAEAMAVLTALRLAMNEFTLDNVSVIKIRCERTANAAERELANRREVRERVNVPGAGCGTEPHREDEGDDGE